MHRATLQWMVGSAVVAGLSGASALAAPTGSPLGAREASLSRSIEASAGLPAGSIQHLGWQREREVPTFLRGRDLARGQVRDAASARRFAHRIQSLWGLSLEPGQLTHLRSLTDAFGDVHIFRQMYRGLEVFDRQIRISADPEGRVFAVASNLRGIRSPLQLSPELDLSEAVSYAESEGRFLVSKVDRSELGIYFEDDSPILAYRFLLELESGKLYHVMVDANSGKLLSAQPDQVELNGPVTAPAVDDFGASIHINAFRYEGGYFPMLKVRGYPVGTNGRTLLRNADKGLYNLMDTTRPYGWIYTLDGANSDAMAQNDEQDFTDPYYGPYVTTQGYMGLALDFYNDRYDRLSYDGQSSAVVEVVERQDYANASWSRSGYYITFGAGDGVTYRSFGDDATVAVHELSHGFTQFTSELDYSLQPGAINEAVSDVMGWSAVRQNEYGKSGDISVLDNWLIGEDLYYDDGMAIRDLEVPQRFRQVDHMHYYLCTGDVHYNSGIPNMAFVRMVEGNEGTGTDFPVTPLESNRYASVDAATDLFYEANSRLLTAEAQFLDLWEALLASVPDAKPEYADTINDTFESLAVCSDDYTNACNQEAGSQTDSHMVLTGSSEWQFMGSFLSNSGDFDGDGRQDILARHYDMDAEVVEDAVWADIFWGTSSGYETTPTTAGYTGGNFGEAFGLGDINGDGLDDVILGVTSATDLGMVVIIPGNSSRSLANLTNVVTSGVLEDGFATTVAYAGDLNRDGYGDFVVGAPDANDGAGQVYVYFGAADMSDLSGVSLPTPSESIGFGSWVSGVGDVNGDGYDDVAALGKTDLDQDIASPGRLFVGASSFTGSLNFSIEAGIRVRPVGDLNADGKADFVVANTTAVVNGYDNAGEAFVYHGSGSLSSPLSPAMTLMGSHEQEYFGRYIEGADLNNDGYDDLFLTSFEDPYVRKGIVNVFPGSSSGAASTPVAQWIGDYGQASFGYGISRRRDANDSEDRVVISAPGYLPWDSGDYCRVDYVGAFYIYTSTDMP